MTIRQIVDPSQIEPELLRIWDQLAKKDKVRASLFNLIIFTKFSPRIDYFRNIVQKVVEKFPCRTLFISHDPNAARPYLKSAISVQLIGPGQDPSIACDQIDIGVGGKDLEQVAYLILPHLLPDLPNYLLWAEDPSTPNPLFSHLAKLSSRIIFDSESANDLLHFAKTILQLKKDLKVDIGDLNWARTGGWRDLVAYSFNPQEKQTLLQNISLVQIFYNSQETEFFCHLKIQAMYLLAWLANRLGWQYTKATSNLSFQFQKITGEIHPEKWQRLGPGTVTAINIHTQGGALFEAKRIPEAYHHVKIQFSTPSECDLPYRFVLGQTATGQSLVQEICTKGTSLHYIQTLESLDLLHDANLG